MIARSNEPALPASHWLLLIAVGLSSLMSSMQGSALNAILPFVARSLEVDLPTIQWVVLVYLIASSGLLPAFGRLGDMIGQRRLYLTGFVGFIIGSVLCTLAPSVLWLIAARTVQAVGSGMITTSSTPLITKSLPASHRGRGLSAQIFMVYCGLSAGPGVGGILADTLGWRWVFLVNVPVGLLAAAIALAVIPKDEGTPSSQGFDVGGALTFMTGLAAFFLLLGGGRGQHWPWGGSGALVAITAVSTAAFVILELRRREPMLDLRLFKRRFFSAATSSAMINYTGYSATIFLAPFYLVNGLGYDATNAGALITAMPVTMMFFAPFSGWLFDKFGPRFPTSVGMALLSGGIFLMSRLGSAPSVMDIVPRLMLTGMGIGLFSSANGSAILGSVPREVQGMANGVVSIARQLGMMLGVAVATAVFSARHPLYTGLGEATATAAAARDAFFLAAAIALVGVFTSLVRGKSSDNYS
ncbi:MAG: MFS transporter [Deltaproteobacteria bacterium]|nr:MFS transporter [Deltaproteobacteria bacterium]